MPQPVPARRATSEPTARRPDRAGPGCSRSVTPTSAAPGSARRRRRFVRIAVVLWTLVGLAWLRALTMAPARGFLPLPHVDPFLLTIIIFFGLMIASPWASRSSPAGRRT